MKQTENQEPKRRVDAVPTEGNPGIYSLIKVSGKSKEFIGYATPLSLLGSVPVYEKDKLQAEHILLQKIQNKNGDKSLLYMLPVETADNRLIGGILFQKTKTEQGEEVKFKGSVGLNRFMELQKLQIPLDEAPKVPFESIENVKRIEPDTELAILFDHYVKPKHQMNPAIQRIITGLAYRGLTK